MIDSTPAFVAPTGKQSTWAKSSAAAPSKSGGEASGFAEFLAQSTERAGAMAESAAARGYSSDSPDLARENDDKTDTIRVEAANGAGLAAPIAAVAAESLAALLPLGGKPSAGTPGVTPDTLFASAASAGAASSGPAARSIATASGPAVRSIATASASEGAGDPGFAEVLAQSTEQAGVRAESSAGRELSAVSPDLAPPKKETKSETTRAVPAGGVNPAAPIVLAAAKGLPALLPVGGKPSADNPGLSPDTRSVSAAPVGAVPSGAAVRLTAKAPAIGDPANASAGLIQASDELPVPSPAIAIDQTAGTDRKPHRAPATDAAAREGPQEGPAGRTANNPVTQQARSTEFRNDSVSQKSDEQHLPAAHQVETAPVVNLAPGAAAHAAGPHSLIAAGPGATLLVPTHVESPAWSKNFGQHVIRLAVEGQPAAEIHLNPPDWGPIRVSIEIKGQEATLQFDAPHPQTREALEGALPRLREMFAADNLTLAGANVTGQSFSPPSSGSQGHRFNQPPAPVGNGRSLAVEDAVPGAIAAPRPTARRSRVDLFA